LITRSLVVINVVVFFWEILTMGPGILSGNVTGQQLVNDGALVPIAVTQYHEYWRVVTSAFLHANILHIALNMYSLYVLGRFVEPVLGSPRMLFVYTVSLLAAGTCVAYFSQPDVPTLGASGAIFGIFGALFAIGFKFGRRGMELIKAMLPILIINLIFTFTVPAISWQAHVGGLVVGFLLTFIIYFPPRPIRPYAYDHGEGSYLDTEYQEAPKDVQSDR
jgi:membrane associated rhomboid family serine protease